MFKRFALNLYNQTEPLVIDLLCFVMKQIFDSNSADAVRAFNATSRCLDDLLNIDNPSFEQ